MQARGKGALARSCAFGAARDAALMVSGAVHSGIRRHLQKAGLAEPLLAQRGASTSRTRIRWLRPEAESCL